jgi:hypothetical protein
MKHATKWIGMATLLGLLASVAGEARAGLIVDINRSTFNAAGTINYNSNFNDFGSGFSLPGDPFTRGGVTYTNTRNLIAGTATRYNPVVNLMTNDFWSPLTGSLDASARYNMFGFDFGVLARQDQISVEVDTSTAAGI